MTDSKKPTAEKTSAKKKADASPTEVNWKQLKHHDGSAVDVPEWVAKLAGGNAKRNYAELESAFLGPDEVCSAAAPTLALLFEHLEGAKNPSWVLRLAAQIVGNDQLSGWLRDPADVPSEAAQVLEAHIRRIDWALGHAEETVRSAAGFLLGTASRDVLVSLQEKIVARLEAESSEFVLASLLLAYGRAFGALSVTLEQRLKEHESALVRGALAVSGLRAGKPLADAIDGLESWFGAQTLDDRAPQAFWWWWESLRLQRRNVALENFIQGPVLVAELCARGARQREWSDPIIEAAERWKSGRARRSATEFLIHAWDLGGEPDGIRVPSTQPADLQWLFGRLLRSRLFARAGYGLPGCGGVRARWLGKADSTVMESLVPARSGEPDPLYRVYASNKESDEDLVERLGLRGFERWQFYASRACGEYGPATPPPTELLEQLIQDAASDPRIRDIGRIYADEVGARVAEWDDQEIRHRFGPANSALIVLPLVMAGVPWEERWESALAFDEDEPELGRRLFGAVPLARRDAYLTTNPPRLRHQLAFMDLWSSPLQVSTALQTIDDARRDGYDIPSPVIALEERVRKLARTRPIFTEGLAQFEKARAPK